MLGQFHSNNLGDQAIYQAFRNMLNELDEFRIESFPIKAKEFTKLGRRFSGFWILQVLHVVIIGIPRHYAALYNKLRAADLLIIGGGNLIMDHSLLSPIQFLATCCVGNLSGVKIFVAAIGAGPIKYRMSAYLYRQSLRLVDRISVRDTYSLEVLTDPNGINFSPNEVLLTADPAFTIAYQCSDPVRSKRIIGISILDFQSTARTVAGDREKFEKYTKDMASLIEELINLKVAGVKLIPTDAPYDVMAMEDIAKQVRDEQLLCLEYPQNVDQLLRALCECDALVGTRMHSMILALTQYVPVVGLSWAGKIDSLFAAIGKPSYTFDIEDFDPKAVAGLVNEVSSRSSEFRADIEDKLKYLQALARQNAIVAANLIDKELED